MIKSKSTSYLKSNLIILRSQRWHAGAEIIQLR
jgi:hypothetical protein